MDEEKECLIAENEGLTVQIAEIKENLQFLKDNKEQAAKEKEMAEKSVEKAERNLKKLQECRNQLQPIIDNVNNIMPYLLIKSSIISIFILKPNLIIK